VSVVLNVDSFDSARIEGDICNWICKKGQYPAFSGNCHISTTIYDSETILVTVQVFN